MKNIFCFDKRPKTKKTQFTIHFYSMINNSSTYHNRDAIYIKRYTSITDNTNIYELTNHFNTTISHLNTQFIYYIYNLKKYLYVLINNLSNKIKINILIERKINNLKINFISKKKL